MYFNLVIQGRSGRALHPHIANRCSWQTGHRGTKDKYPAGRRKWLGPRRCCFTFRQFSWVSCSAVSLGLPVVFMSSVARNAFRFCSDRQRLRVRLVPGVQSFRSFRVFRVRQCLSVLRPFSCISWLVVAFRFCPRSFVASRDTGSWCLVIPQFSGISCSAVPFGLAVIFVYFV